MIASARPLRSTSRATTSTDEATSASAHRRRPFDLFVRTVLLAMDGSAGAAAAANVALALATTFHAHIHVLSVIDTRGAPVPPALDRTLALGNEVGGEGEHHAQMNAVRTAITTATSVRTDWPVRVVMGTPAKAIVHEAKRLGAALVVVGLHPHGGVPRATNGETVLQVIQNARCAVLAVAPGMLALPRRALAAVDFTPASILAARMACGLLDDNGTVVLGYVSGPSATLPESGDPFVDGLEVRARLERTARELTCADLSFAAVVLRHERPSSPAAMLLDYADGTNSMLIAAGSSRLDHLDRWTLGSVCTDLVRDGRHSVLIVPP